MFYMCPGVLRSAPFDYYVCVFILYCIYMLYLCRGVASGAQLSALFTTACVFISSTRTHIVSGAQLSALFTTACVLILLYKLVRGHIYSELSGAQLQVCKIRTSCLPPFFRFSPNKKRLSLLRGLQPIVLLAATSPRILKALVHESCR
jgi:hypothetical protein